MTVIVTAVFHPKEGAHDELVAALREGIPAVHEEPGCLLYAIHEASDGTITMIEKWTTAESLDAHARGQAVAALNALVSAHLASPTIVTTMTPISAGTAEQGAL